MHPTPRQDTIFVVNAGSSSIKFAAYGIAAGDALQLGLHGQVEALGTAPRFAVKNAAGEELASKEWATGVWPGHAGAMQHLMDTLPGLLHDKHVCALGHRVVHGGMSHSAPVRADAPLLAELQALTPLAPQHQPFNLAPIQTALQLAPQLLQVACFDTAFHRSQPAVAQALPLPRALTQDGLRRYGFHGISYEYLASTMAQAATAQAGDALTASLQGRVVAMHLGNGASLCAMRAGQSVATTMGFTALDGLMMGTRCGSLDPGVVLHLIQEQGMTPQQVQTLLYEQSGLLGVSGVSKDMRQLQASDAPLAAQAIELYLYRIRLELGAMAAALGGLDALVFSAGIGENSAAIRAQVCRDAAWLGVDLDDQANQAAAGSGRGSGSAALRCISKPGSAVSAWVIPTDEALMIARHTLALLRGHSPQKAE